MSKDSLAGRYIYAPRIDDPFRDTDDVRVLGGGCFWNLWSRRLNPYQTLRNGDTLYLLDWQKRELTAELRVVNLITQPYTSVESGLAMLESIYGMDPAERKGNNYNAADGPGYLLAFEVDAVARMAVPFPYPLDRLGARHGWLSLATFATAETIDQVEREATLSQIPDPGRPAAAEAGPLDTGGVRELSGPRRGPRAPTFAVRRQVLERSDGICELEGCEMSGRHFDHIYPWSKGGNSELVNIRWLCAQHNLAKSDRLPDAWTPEQLWFQWSFIGKALPTTEWKIGAADTLEALEVRTGNSTYQVVRDDGLVYVWRTNEHTVMVSRDPGAELIGPGPEGKGNRLWLFDPDDPDGPGLRSSTVSSVDRSVDPVELLRRINSEPGRLVKASGLVGRGSKGPIDEA